VKALGSLLSAGSPKPIGLNKLLGTVLQDGYSLLGVSSSDTKDKAEDALAGAVVSLGKLAETKDARRAVVSLNGDASLSAQEVGLAVDRLGSIMNNEEVDVEYSVEDSGSAQLQVSLLASSFKSTKYDGYDPLAKILGDRVLDGEMDACLPEGSKPSSRATSQPRRTRTFFRSDSSTFLKTGLGSPIRLPGSTRSSGADFHPPASMGSLNASWSQMALALNGRKGLSSVASPATRLQE